MDSPELDAALHRGALTGLRTINRVSRTASAIWGHLRCHRPADRPLRVLDVACGGGDVLISIHALASRERADVQLLGIDRSPTAVEHARAAATAAGAPIAFDVGEALADPFQNPWSSSDPFDFVICSLFLHHLEEPEALRLLTKMREASGVGVVVDDLRRSRWGYALAWIGGRLLSRSPLVHMDGPLSVRAAFTCEEARMLAKRADMAVEIFPRWPQRFTLRWLR